MSHTKIYDCFSNAGIPNTHAPFHIRANRSFKLSEADFKKYIYNTTYTTDLKTEEKK